MFTPLIGNINGGWPRLGLLTLAALLWLSRPGLAHSVEAHEPAPSGAQVGVVERLGAKLPLELTFRDETGRACRLSELVTCPTIVLPVYYGCSNVCNFLQGDLARVLPDLKGTPGVDYRVLSVSIDETETPQLAARYQKMYLTAMNAPFPREGWRFLTGDAGSIRRLTGAAGFSFQRRGHEFLHPVVSFVVAPDGTIVRYLYGTNFLAKDLALALIEARAGRTGATIRKVVDYCFSFDPKVKSYQFNLLRVSATVILISSGGFFLFLLATGRKGGRRHSGGK